MKLHCKRGTRHLIYCSQAAQEEVSRAFPWRRSAVAAKAWLGLMPVVDGCCSHCGKAVRTVR